MIKSLFVALLLAHFPLMAFEKLPAEYQISYGNPSAAIRLVEYFSLSCPKCLESFKKDFPFLKQKYIQTQKVFWTFHLNPADLLTLQAIVCLEKLTQDERRIFWEVVLDNLDDPSEGTALMKIAMETFGKPLPNLDDLAYLENTPALRAAYKYLKQPDTIKELPTVEINEKIYEAFPRREFLEKQFARFLTQGDAS